jgi:uncharacterized membrane protein YhaH (DUF805 family)
MNFAQASVLPLKRYAEFRGRSTRTEVIAFYVLIMITQLIAQFAVNQLWGEDAKPWLEGGLGVIFLVPTLSVFVRRLHDTGRSGWWLLIGAPCVATGIWEVIARPRPFTLHIQMHLPWWAMVPTILCALALFFLLLWDDDVGANRYGPNPRGWPPGEPA